MPSSKLSQPSPRPQEIVSASFQSPNLQSNPRVSSIVRSVAPAGRSLVAPKLLPAPLLRKGYVLQFRNNLYLCDYRSDGVWATAALSGAKVFSVPPFEAADLFCARVIVVLANADGSGARRTLINPALAPLTQQADGRLSTPNGVSIEAPFAKEGNEEEAKLTCEETEQSETATEANGPSDEVKSNGNADHGEARQRRSAELTQKGTPNRTEGARHGEAAGSFFYVKPRHARGPGEEIFVQFLECYLSAPDYPIRLQGTQPALHGSDLLLFDGPASLIGNLSIPTTLAIEANLLTKPRAEVLEILKTKIDLSRKAFAGSK